MNNYIKIVKGHYNAAHEHKIRFGLEHKVTWLQSILTTISDCIKYNTIEIDGAYLVYDVRRVYTLGIVVAGIRKIYVPKENRGNGLASKLKDLIPYDTVIEEFSVGEDCSKYRQVGTIVLVRKNIQ